MPRQPRDPAIPHPRARTLSVSREALVTGLLLGCGVLLVLLVYWPGLIHWDTAQIVREAQHGPIINWWSGFGTLILRACFAVGIGPPLVWSLIVIATILGIYGCLRVVLRRVPAACATLLAATFPPIYADLSTFSRDSAYVGFSLLAFASLAACLRHGRTRRGTYLALGAISAALAAISRLDGVAVVFATVVFAGLSDRRISARAVVSTLAIGTVAAALGIVVLKTLDQAAPIRNVHPERMTYVYDLAAISTETGHDQFPLRALRFLPPGGAARHDLTESTLRREFRLQDSSSLRGVGGMDFENASLAARESSILRNAWLGAIAKHPIAYMRERLDLYAALIGLGSPAPDTAAFLVTFAYQPLDSATNFGHPLAFPRAYLSATHLLGFFLGRHATVPLDRAWVYLILIALSLLIVIRLRTREAVVAAALGATVFVHHAILFFTTMAASFRYVYMTPFVTILVLVYALSGIVRSRGLALDAVLEPGAGRRLPGA